MKKKRAINKVDWVFTLRCSWSRSFWMKSGWTAAAEEEEDEEEQEEEEEEQGDITCGKEALSRRSHHQTLWPLRPKL